MKTTKKAVISGFAMIGAAVLLAGCGAAPESAGGASAGAGAGASDYLPCMVSDAGGFDDKSFNQLGKEGVDEAASSSVRRPPSRSSRRPRPTTPPTSEPGRPGLQHDRDGRLPPRPRGARVGQGQPRPRIRLDRRHRRQRLRRPDRRPNIKPIIFDTAQAAYLAGYLAAGHLEDRCLVGTFGGLNIPTVSIFMDGFAQGVEKYNTDNGTSVRVVGWDRAPGRLLHRWVRGQRHRRVRPPRPSSTRVDVLLPVGGPIYSRPPSRSRCRSRDRPGRRRRRPSTRPTPRSGDLLLTSILKGIDVGTKTPSSPPATASSTPLPSSERSRTRVWAWPPTTTGPTGFGRSHHQDR